LIRYAAKTRRTGALLFQHQSTLLWSACHHPYDHDDLT